jgi:hypothetical protein
MRTSTVRQEVGRQVVERPLLLCGPMVKAILGGRKTQTRRLVFRDGDPDCHMPWWCRDHWQDGDEMLHCPNGKPGDRLWVRETFRAIEDPGAQKHEVRRRYRDDGGETHCIVVDYKVDAPTRIMDEMGKPEWKPSIHMPRWASRLILELTAVGVERVQAITEADAIAEGFGGPQEFGRSWDGLYGKRPGCAWADDPWVWVLSFEVTKCA